MTHDLKSPEEAKNCKECCMLTKNPHLLSNVMICKLGYIHVMDLLTIGALKKQKLCKGEMNSVPLKKEYGNIKKMTSLNNKSLI
ncbi:hypothetical protein LCGC14_1642600, partial [marine sediment metagenome]